MRFNKKFSAAKGHFRDTNLVCALYAVMQWETSGSLKALTVMASVFALGMVEAGGAGGLSPPPPPPLCVEIWFSLEIFPRNQDVTVKLKPELIFIKKLYFFNVLANPKPICFTQTISSMFKP